MKTDTKEWLYHQFKGAFIIIAVSLVLAVTTNMLRNTPLPLVEQRQLLKTGDRFPYIPIPVASIPDKENYLGLPPHKEMVTLDDIQADLLVIEVLNVFCFPCQTQTLVLNKVYQLIEKKPDLNDRIKILGVALGGTKEIVNDFVKDYEVLFPVISDTELRTEKIIGPGIHTPFSLFVLKDESGKLGLIAETHDGPIEDSQILMDGLIALLEKDFQKDSLNPLFGKGTNPTP